MRFFCSKLRWFCIVFNFYYYLCLYLCLCAKIGFLKRSVDIAFTAWLMILKFCHIFATLNLLATSLLFIYILFFVDYLFVLFWYTRTSSSFLKRFPITLLWILIVCWVLVLVLVVELYERDFNELNVSTQFKWILEGTTKEDDEEKTAYYDCLLVCLTDWLTSLSRILNKDYSWGTGALFLGISEGFWDFLRFSRLRCLVEMCALCPLWQSVIQSVRVEQPFNSVESH